MGKTGRMGYEIRGMGRRVSLVEKLSSGKSLLPGCIPAVYKLRGIGHLGNIYEWLCYVKRGIQGWRLACRSVNRLALRLRTGRIPGMPQVGGRGDVYRQ